MTDPPPMPVKSDKRADEKSAYGECDVHLGPIAMWAPQKVKSGQLSIVSSKSSYAAGTPAAANSRKTSRTRRRYSRASASEPPRSGAKPLRQHRARKPEAGLRQRAGPLCRAGRHYNAGRERGPGQRIGKQKAAGLLMPRKGIECCRPAKRDRYGGDVVDREAACGLQGKCIEVHMSQRPPSRPRARDRPRS